MVGFEVDLHTALDVNLEAEDEPLKDDFCLEIIMFIASMTNLVYNFDTWTS